MSSYIPINVHAANFNEVGRKLNNIEQDFNTIKTELISLRDNYSNIPPANMQQRLNVLVQRISATSATSITDWT